MAGENAEIKGLEFKVVGEVGSALKSLDSLAKTLSTLRNATKGSLGLKKVGKELQEFSNIIKDVNVSNLGLDKFAATLSKLREATKGSLGLMKIGNQYKNFVESIKNTSPADLKNVDAFAKSLNGLVEPIKNIREAMGTEGSNIATLFKGIKQYNTAIQKGLVTPKDSAKKEVESTKATEELTKNASFFSRVMESVRGSSSKIYSQIGQTFSQAFSKASAHVKQFLSGLKTSVLNAFGNGIRKLASNLKSFIPSLHLAEHAIKNLIGKMKSMASALARIAVYRFMRSLIKGITSALKEGTQNLYQYSQAMGTTFHNSLDRISTDALYLKNSFAAAVAPIVNALAPAIDMLADKIANLLNLIAQLFAALSGATVFSKATKTAKKFGEAAGSAGQAVRYLIGGFDELNVLPSQSGGGGGGDDWGSMFEESPISQNIRDFVKRIKDAIANDEWEEVGAIIAEEMNKIIDKVDDWIVKKFTPAAKLWASRMARILNGFIEKLDWKKLGKTFADGMNGVFGAIETFLDTFKAKRFGQKLGETIKSFFDNVDWKMVGRTFAKKWNDFFHIIEGIVTTPGLWTSIGNAIGDFIKNWFASIDLNSLATIVINLFNGVRDAIKAFLSKKPFEGVGKKIGDAINRVLHEVDWAGLAKALSDLFMDLLKALWEAADTIDWEGLGKAIGEFIGNIDWWGIFTKAADIIFKAFTGVLKGLLSTDGGRAFVALLAAIKGLKLAFIIAKPFVQEGVKLFARGIMSHLDELPGKIKGVGTKIGSALKGIMGTQVTSGVGAGGVAASAGAAGLAAVAGVGLGLEASDIIQPGSKEQFIEAFNDTYSADSLWGNIKIWAEEWGRIFSSAWTGMVDNATTAWGVISNFFSEAWSGMVDNAKTAGSVIGGFFTEAWNGMVENCKTAWAFVSGWFSQAVTDVGNWLGKIWSDVSGWFSNTATNIGQWFSTAWQNVSTWFSTAITNIGGWFSSIWTDVSTWFSNTASEIGSWFSTAWTDITSWFGTAISDVGSWFSNIWKDLSTWFSNTKTNISTWFSTAWQNISTWFSTAISNVGKFFTDVWGKVKGFFSGTKTESDTFGTTMQGNAQGFFSRMGTTIGTWFSNTWKDISGWFGSLPSKIGDFFKDAGSWLLNAGKNIINGLWNGIKEIWNSLTTWISQAAQDVVNTFNDVFKIGSPSKVMHEIGEYLDMGLGEGILGGERDLLMTASDMASRVTDNLTPQINGSIIGQTPTMPDQDMLESMDGSILNVLMNMFEWMQTNDNNQQGDVKVIIDGKEVFNAVVNENNRQIRRTGGVSPLRV